MRTILSFTLLILVATSGFASGRGTCSFEGKILEMERDSKDEAVFNLETLTDPDGYCGCGANVAKGKIVTVNFNRKQTRNFIADEKNKAFASAVNEQKSLLSRSEKLKKDYKGKFSARCFDGMGSQGCLGSCGAWLPD